MSDAATRDKWERTSWVLALTANVNRGKGTKAFKPEDFNPILLAKKKGDKKKNVIHSKNNWKVLKETFVKKGQPNMIAGGAQNG